MKVTATNRQEIGRRPDGKPVFLDKMPWLTQEPRALKGGIETIGYAWSHMHTRTNQTARMKGKH